MPSLSNMGSRRESWPPTQLRLVRSGSNKSLEPRPLLEDIDEDPLTYFLTPSADDEDDDDNAAFSDDEDAIMDFDAGIEIAGQPRDITRSVSPSTLDGLRKLGLGGHHHYRAASPDFDSDGLTSDDDDYDGEDYIRFSPSPPPSNTIRTRSPSSLLSAMPRHSSFSGAFGFRARSPVLGATNGFLSPASSFPAPSPPRRQYAPALTVAAAGPRGRSTFASRRGRSLANPSASARVSRPGHLWREPSADVWSIEEETEEELMMSETSLTVRSERAKAIPGAKPIKRVRFVLPGEQ